MYSKTRFHKLVEIIPASLFKRAENHCDSSRYDKNFNSRRHLLALLFGQLSGANTLRTIAERFNQQDFDHYHLDACPLKKSTLADANARRNPEFFKFIADSLMAQVHSKQKSELAEMLYLLDSTSIHLSGLGFDDWVHENKSDRCKGLKVHTMISSELTPCYINITNPNLNDLSDARTMAIESGATYVFDKGYTDYSWWYDINMQGAFFVTRLKKNAALNVVKNNEIVDEHILSDEIVEFKNRSNRAKHKNRYFGTELRRVSVKVDYKDEPIILVTNDLNRTANEIAQLYKDRWQIELFFKWIKQNLKIKRFLGRSKNAVIIQIYAAIISFMLVWLYRENESLTNISLYILMHQLASTLGKREETDLHIHYRERRKYRLKFIQALQPELAF